MSFRIPPWAQRMLATMGAGALMGTGAASGLGVKFLEQLLQPLSQKESALEFIGRYMAQDEMQSWGAMSDRERATWRRRAKNALTALSHLVAQGLAGKIAPKKG